MRRDSPDRVTVRQAAKELGITMPTLRYKMIHGMLDIGQAWRREGASNYTFEIYRGLLDREKARLGISG